MDQQVAFKKYLILEKHIDGPQLYAMVDKIEKYPDIRDEFYYWLEHRNYDKQQPLVVENYTAKQIYQLNPRLDGIGVYNFLITLREKPDVAKTYITSGFNEL